MVNFKVGDKVRRVGPETAFNLLKVGDVYEIEEIVRISTEYKYGLVLKGFPYRYNWTRFALARNGGKVRFTYTEVPPGTEYSHFLAWSRRHK